MTHVKIYNNNMRLKIVGYSFIVSSTEQWANNLCVSKGSVFCLAGNLSNHFIFLFIHFLSTGKFLFQVRKLEVAQQYDFTIEAFFCDD